MRFEIRNCPAILRAVKDERAEGRVVPCTAMGLFETIPNNGLIFAANAALQGPAANFAARTPEHIDFAKFGKIATLIEVAEKITVERFVMKESRNQAAVSTTRLEVVVAFVERNQLGQWSAINCRNDCRDVMIIKPSDDEGENRRGAIAFHASW